MEKFVRNQDTISGQIDEDLVMVDIEKGNYYALNAIGTRIWELLETPKSLDEICDILMTEYEVSRDKCQNEVLNYIRKMEGLSLILSK